MFDGKKLELGQKSAYDSHYNKDKLLAIARKIKRDEIGIDSNNLPFYGFDRWNHYEVSWLNSRGKPIVALAQIDYSADSPNIIESKSMKLYFNSFNNTKFASEAEVEAIIKQDLTEQVGVEVFVKIIPLAKLQNAELKKSFDGICIDDLDIECSDYTVTPSHLVTEDEIVTEVLYSDLLKSNCLVTEQPDWGSVQISYTGKKISRAGLLKYLVSFRNHNEFHEQCIERIFVDLMKYCAPDELTVFGAYTRRGGVDINPYRSSLAIGMVIPSHIRLCRQ